MKIIVGKILKVNVTEMPPKDWGKGPVRSFKHTFTVQGIVDQESEETLFLSKFDKQEDGLAYVGNNVLIAFSSKTQKGKDGKDVTYHTIDKLEVKGHREVKQTTPETKKEVVESKDMNQGKVFIKGVNNSPSSKDVSMEVSGLLQAIIHKHGLDEKTEKLLRDALELKRKVAKDYE